MDVERYNFEFVNGKLHYTGRVNSNPEAIKKVNRNGKRARVAKQQKDNYFIKELLPLAGLLVAIVAGGTAAFQYQDKVNNDALNAHLNGPKDSMAATDSALAKDDYDDVYYFIEDSITNLKNTIEETENSTIRTKLMADYQTLYSMLVDVRKTKSELETAISNGSSAETIERIRNVFESCVREMTGELAKHSYYFIPADTLEDETSFHL